MLDNPIFAAAAHHFAAAGCEDQTWSETTRRSIAMGSAAFSIEQLESMLAPGNPVNKRWRDIYYRIDGSAVDTRDPVMLRLLDIASGCFGAPEAALTVEGRTVSHIALHSAIVARRVIAAAEKTGKSHPAILEIGGGLGIVLGFLRRYYGCEATLFAIDVPEGLFLQEWFVRNSDPNTAASYAPGPDPVRFVTGGINLINAASHASHAVPADVAYTVDAFSDMSADTASNYLTFLRRNMTENGRLLLIASYAQGNDGVAAPSEYEFGDGWSLDRLEMLDPTESMQPEEQLLIELVRSGGDAGLPPSRLALRHAWNLLAGRHVAGRAFATSDIRTFCHECSRDPLGALGDWNSAHGVSMDVKDAAALERHIYLRRDVHISNIGARSQNEPAVVVADARRALVRSMEEARTPRVHIDGIRRTQADAFEPLRAGLATASGSIFWTAQMAGILLPVLACSEAASRLADTAMRCSDAGWQVRSAALLERYGFSAHALDCLNSSENGTGSSEFFDLKRAELLMRLSCTERAFETLERCRRIPSSGDQWTMSFAKTALRLGEEGAATVVARDALDHCHGSRLYDIVSFAIAETGTLPAAFADILDEWEARRSDIGEPAGLASLLHASGQHARADAILQAAVDWNDHYGLAGAGRKLLLAGATGIGRKCLEASALAARSSFLHQEFVGTAFLDAGDFDKAAAYLDCAAGLCPILVHLHAKAAFARLPQDVREAGVFGTTTDLQVLFQRWQDFYHDTGPRFR